MSYVSDLEKLKNDSLGRDSEKLGVDLFKEVEIRSRKITKKVNKKLRQKKPNRTKIQENEKFATRQAMATINVDEDINRLFRFASPEYLRLRTAYYKDTTRRLADVFNDNTPPFVEFTVSFTNRDLQNITRQVLGTDINKHLNQLRDRTKARMQDVINDAYRQSTIDRLEFTETYIEQVRGVMRSNQRQMEAKFNQLIVAVFENAQNDFQQGVDA